MRKFPSIEQFRHCVRAERDQAAFEDRAPAVRRYRGTVKLHGTNAGVVWRAGEPLVFQSRSRIIKPGDDNAGFASFFSEPSNQHWLKLAMAEIATSNSIAPDIELAVFGEWCGEGIQRGVALNHLPRMFVIFAAWVGGQWLDVSGLTTSYAEGRVFGVHSFPTHEVVIDFTNPELAQNEMVSITEAVEAECPAGAHFGVTGIGEGIVWAPIDGDRDAKYWFKVKGEKHSSSKVATLAAVDVERFHAKERLVEALVTENRLQQGLDVIQRELGLKLQIQNIGHFLRWVFSDIVKEEADTIAASGFEQKELGKPISDIAKRFFLKALDADVAIAA